MKLENKKYAETAWNIVKHASEEIGSRLPGSEGEKKFASYMSDKLHDLGIEPKKEEFAVAPRATVGGIPYAGWVGLILSGLTYFALAISSLWFGMALAGIACVIWLIFSVFFYKKWFDKFFRQRISQNVYGELLPEDGKYDYTIVVSAHTDTSWNWNHSVNTYKYRDGKKMLGLVLTYLKVGFGAICVFFNIGVSIFMAALQLGLMLKQPWAVGISYSFSFQIFYLLLHFLPIITAIGSGLVILWADPHEENASKGAMDNATGIGINYAVMQYFKENPDKMPKNCRIIDLNCGSEEAGLRGSMAFTEEHKNDEMLKNCWNINVDSIADKDYFEVVIKDDWQLTRFDKDMEKMFKDTFNELGIVSKTNGCIHNPVGGCDSTPFTRAGVKSVTFAAQDPTLTYYYHTWRDRADRFDEETVGNGFDVVLSVIDKIAAFQEEKGYPGKRTK